MPNINLSDQIRNTRAGVVSNPYQSPDRKVVFVCTMGILRSATAARMYAKQFNTRAAGTDPTALIPLSILLIDWADEVVFVNKHNFQQAEDKFGEEIFWGKVTVLDIPDQYPHMHTSLRAAFRKQYGKMLASRDVVSKNIQAQALQM
jgi:predicted protein tyrosine phosphatase